MRRSEVFLSASVSTIDDFLISEIGQTLPSEGFLFQISCRLSLSSLPCFSSFIFVTSIVHACVSIESVSLFPCPPLFLLLFRFFLRCSRDNAGSALCLQFFSGNRAISLSLPDRGTRNFSKSFLRRRRSGNGNVRCVTRANSSRWIRRADVRIDRRPFFRDLPNQRAFPFVNSLCAFEQLWTS